MIFRTKRCWLVEFYTKGPRGQKGWEIKFAWVRADSGWEARQRVLDLKGTDAIITLKEFSKPEELHLSAGNTPVNLWTR